MTTASAYTLASSRSNAKLQYCHLVPSSLQVRGAIAKQTSKKTEAACDTDGTFIVLLSL